LKYAWIKEHSKRFDIKRMCRLFTVSRNCYYRWLKIDKKDDYQLNELIKNIFETSRKTYGTRRIKKKLEQLYGLIISRRKIARIMKNLSLKCLNKRRFRVQTTDSNHRYMISPNLLKQDFYASCPDQIYVGDITYIPTAEGWLYLATVIDLYSRKIVGWSMDGNMTTSLVNDALFMAIKKRSPHKGLIFHSDRGSQYASDSHRELLNEFGIKQSMSAKGNCYDNAVAESFFHSLKTELTHHIKFETRAQANQSIFEYIEVFYNRQRLHSSNNYMSPVDYEEKMLQKEMIA
jgi:putative transposase